MSHVNNNEEKNVMTYKKKTTNHHTMTVYWLRRTHTKDGHDVEYYFRRAHGITKAISYSEFQIAMKGRHEIDTNVLRLTGKLTPVHHAHVVTSYDRNGGTSYHYYVNEPANYASEPISSNHFFAATGDSSSSLSHVVTLVDNHYAKDTRIPVGITFHHDPIVVMQSTGALSPLVKYVMLPANSKVRGTCFSENDRKAKDALQKLVFGNWTDIDNNENFVVVDDNKNKGVAYKACIGGESNCKYVLIIIPHDENIDAKHVKQLFNTRKLIFKRLAEKGAAPKLQSGDGWLCSEHNDEYYLFDMPQYTLAEALQKNEIKDKSSMVTKLNDLMRKANAAHIGFRGRISAKDIVIDKRGNPLFFNLAQAVDYNPAQASFGGGLTIVGNNDKWLEESNLDNNAMIKIIEKVKQ